MTTCRYARDLYDRIIKLPGFQHQRQMLMVAGYPHVENERELVLVLKTLQRIAYPPRSGGIF